MELFVACYEASGDLRWLRTAGGEDEAFAEGRQITMRGDGTLEIGGVAAGAVSFAGDKTPPLVVRGGAEEPFVARLDAGGRILGLRPRR